MQLGVEAIICAVRAHGENGVIARVMTAEHGLLTGYVRGGRGRRIRPILIPGNIVAAQFRSRSEDQMPSLSVELVQSRAPLMTEPLPAVAMEWATLLPARTLPEGQGYPAVYAALDAVLNAIAMAPSARGWATMMVLYELALLRALGFGLSLDACVVTGAVDDLAFVSPKSAAAVSVTAASGYEGQLLPLPAFILDGSSPTLSDALTGLRLSGYFIMRRLFDGARNDPLAVRERMVTRLERAVG